MTEHLSLQCFWHLPYILLMFQKSQATTCCYLNPRKKLDVLHINWCRKSSSNSISSKLTSHVALFLFAKGVSNFRDTRFLESINVFSNINVFLGVRGNWGNPRQSQMFTFAIIQVYQLLGLTGWQVNQHATQRPYT